MTLHAPQPESRDEAEFQALMTEVLAQSSQRFSHREHIHLTWLAVRRYGVPRAIDLVSEGIQRTARYAGVPQKYNATLSRAWVELVGHHAFAEPDTDDFAAFVARTPVLLDKRLIMRFYEPATLASPQARTGWTPPDRAPFPWIGVGG